MGYIETTYLQTPTILFLLFNNNMLDILKHEI